MSATSLVRMSERTGGRLGVGELAALTGWHPEYVRMAARAGALGPRAARQGVPRDPDSWEIRVGTLGAARLLALARLERAGVRLFRHPGSGDVKGMTAAAVDALRLLRPERWPEYLVCLAGRRGAWRVRAVDGGDGVAALLGRATVVVVVGAAGCLAAAREAGR